MIHDSDHSLRSSGPGIFDQLCEDVDFYNRTWIPGIGECKGGVCDVGER